jgi:hypothetical protein
MEDAMTKTAPLFYLLSIYTILTFLWRFLVPAHEQSEPNLLIDFEVLFELLTVVGLVSFFAKVQPSYGGSKSTLAATFWIALVASIGILIMRFYATDGWYTGHRVYQPGYGSLQIVPQTPLAYVELARPPAA